MNKSSNGTRRRTVRYLNGEHKIHYDHIWHYTFVCGVCCVMCDACKFTLSLFMHCKQNRIAPFIQCKLRCKIVCQEKSSWLIVEINWFSIVLVRKVCMMYKNFNYNSVYSHWNRLRSELFISTLMKAIKAASKHWYIVSLRWSCTSLKYTKTESHTHL